MTSPSRFTEAKLVYQWTGGQLQDVVKVVIW